MQEEIELDFSLESTEDLFDCCLDFIEVYIPYGNQSHIHLLRTIFDKLITKVTSLQLDLEHANQALNRRKESSDAWRQLYYNSRKDIGEFKEEVTRLELDKLELQERVDELTSQIAEYKKSYDKLQLTFGAYEQVRLSSLDTLMEEVEDAYKRHVKRIEEGHESL